MFYHVGDIRIERMIDKLCVGALGPEQQKEQRWYWVTYVPSYVAKVTAMNTKR